MANSKYYQIRFRGQVSSGWEEWFGGLAQQTLQAETQLSGFLPDQCALMGILDVIHNLGLTLIHVNCLDAPPAQTDPSS